MNIEVDTARRKEQMERTLATAAAQGRIDIARKDGRPVRFFYWDLPEGEIQVDLVEISESEFFEQLEACPHFSEKKCTMFEHGVDQIMFAVDNV
jgi:hypothetical protein